MDKITTIARGVPLHQVQDIAALQEPQQLITVVLRGAGADVYQGLVSTPHRVLYAGKAGDHDNDYTDVDPVAELRIPTFNDQLEGGDIDRMRLRTMMFNGGRNVTGV